MQTRGTVFSGKDSKHEHIRILMSKGKYQEAIAYAEKGLLEDPENPGLISLMSEAKEKRSKYINRKKTFRSTQQINCPGCGAAINLFTHSPEYLQCASCQRVLQEGENGYETRAARGSMVSPWVLELGLVAEIGGQAWQIIGHMYYEGEWKEYDAEESNFYREPSFYHLWVLVSESQEYLYLSEDDEGYSFAKKIIPECTEFKFNRTITFIEYSNGIREPVAGRGDYTLAAFEGEFSWIPRAGNRVTSFELQGREIELTTSASGEKQEYEFFETWPVSQEQLAYYFDLPEEIARIKQKKSDVKSERIATGIAFAAAFICLLFCLLGFFAGQSVLSVSVPVNALGDEGTKVGPFELNNVGDVHQIKISGTTASNSEVWVGSELLDPQSDPVSVFEGEFWRESGYENGEYWSEQNLETSAMFRLEKSGAYALRVFGEVNKGSPTGDIKISVYEGVGLQRYYLMSAVLLSAAGAAIFFGFAFPAVFGCLIIFLIAFTCLMF